MERGSHEGQTMTTAVRLAHHAAPARRARADGGVVRGASWGGVARTCVQSFRAALRCEGANWRDRLSAY